MALSKIDAVNFLTGTIPSGNVATSSLAAAATGKVLQIVSAVLGSQVTTNSSSDQDTGLNANITPSSTSNKILVQVSHNGVLKYTGASALGVKIKLFKDTTELDVLSSEGAWNNTSSYQDAGAVTCDYLDSPNTTSQINYKTTFAAANTSGTNVAIGSASSLSTIVLMEIAG
jgi:hypothetical protein